MYNDQKTKNEGQTICTMIRRQRTKDKQYVQWSEDKERRTSNMYNDQKTKNEGQTICTMIRRQRTKDKQGSTKYFTKNERSRNSHQLKTGDGLRWCGRVTINSYCYTLADAGYSVYVRVFLLPTIFCILLFSLLTLRLFQKKKTHLIFYK